jgi:uncharacterized membrane protein YhaH (DUF805 family)
MKKIFFSLFNFENRIGRLDYFIITLGFGIIGVILDIILYFQNGINVFEILLGHVSAPDIEKIKYLTMEEGTVSDLAWLKSRDIMMESYFWLGISFFIWIHGLLDFWLWLSLLVKRLSDINIPNGLLFLSIFVGFILLTLLSVLLQGLGLQTSIYSILLFKTDAPMLPYVLCYLFLCLKRGTVGENRHGLPPEPIFSKV